jgi:hypothetical protein
MSYHYEFDSRNRILLAVAYDRVDDFELQELLEDERFLMDYMAASFTSFPAVVNRVLPAPISNPASINFFRVLGHTEARPGWTMTAIRPSP